MLDFAVALYDDRVRMLAQAPSLPLFMGRLSFCVANAVAAVGGAGELEPGDVLLYNHPFGTGSHPQDAAVVIVAQRVSTIADSDQIVVLEDGRVVGVGTHAELLETSPTFVEIVQSQLAAEVSA